MKIWLVSEHYFPEETATGYLLTQTAEGIATQFDTHVLTRFPKKDECGRLPRTEIVGNVTIHRRWATTFNRHRLLLRIINMLSTAFQLAWSALWNLRRGDAVLVVTNPPLLPFAISMVAKIKGCRRVLLIHDVYPEVGVATKLLSERGLVTRLVAAANKWLYKGMDRIVVLGRDMAGLAQNKLGAERHDRIVTIPNWADLELVTPREKTDNALLQELGLTDKFVLLYVGNMGRSHGLELIVQAAERLRDEEDIHFLFVGGGAKENWLKSEIERLKLSNITMAGSRPRSQQPVFINACDLSIVSFVPGMAGISVPSRMYNILGAGKPILAIADSNSELALVVEENQVGWVVEPDDADALVNTIIDVRKHIDPEMRTRCRTTVEQNYSLDIANKKYIALFEELAADSQS